MHSLLTFERGNEKMANGKRDVKEMAIARETIYGVIEAVNLEGVNYELVGRATEGLVMRDRDTDEYVVVKVIAKASDFDAFDALDEFEEKAAKAKEKVEKANAKAAKDKAKREKTKADEKAKEDAKPE